MSFCQNLGGQLPTRHKRSCSLVVTINFQICEIYNFYIFCIKFLILKLVLLWFSEEIVSLWTSLSAGALDCVLLVTSIGRYSVDEVKMVEFVANHLFEKEGLLRERILIVITRSEPYLVENKTEAVKWLERESENDVFKHYLNLVDHDTNRIIFVDNRDVTKETDNFEKIRLLQNNHKMAQKVLDPIHQLKGGPVSILHVVKNLKVEITKIDEKIQFEKDEEEKKKLGTY